MNCGFDDSTIHHCLPFGLSVFLEDAGLFEILTDSAFVQMLAMLSSSPCQGLYESIFVDWYIEDVTTNTLFRRLFHLLLGITP